MIRLFFVLIILPALATTTAPALGAPAQDTLALNRDDYGRVHVSLTDRGGETHSYLIDSAAQRHAITETDRARLGLTLGRGVINHANSGDITRAQYARLDQSLFATGPRGGDLVAVMPGDQLFSDDRPLRMVGMDIFRGRRVLIDAPGGALTVNPSLETLDTLALAPIPATLNRRKLITLNVRYQDTDLLVLLATGSSHSLISRAAVRALFGPEKRFSRRQSVFAQRGLNPAEDSFPALALADFCMERWCIGNAVFGLANLDAEAYGADPHANLILIGMDVLARYPFVLDYRYAQVWVPQSALKPHEEPK